MVTPKTPLPIGNLDHMTEIIPITTNHVLSHLRMVGATLGKKYDQSARSRVSKNRRLPNVSGGESPGWHLSSVDRNGRESYTPKDPDRMRMYGTPAEAVMMKFNTQGNKLYKETFEKESEGVLDHLRAQGLTVTQHDTPMSFLVTRQSEV
jgi:hypothetical protein